MPRAPKITAEARKQRTAANLLRPDPLRAAELANTMGVKARTVTRLASDPAVRAIAVGMLEPHRAALARLVPKAIRVIEKALEARIAKGADHAVRLQAVDRLRRMVDLVEDYDFRASELTRGQDAEADGAKRCFAVRSKTC